MGKKSFGSFTNLNQLTARWFYSTHQIKRMAIENKRTTHSAAGFIAHAMPFYEL
jgi:hypothetical protein